MSDNLCSATTKRGTQCQAVAVQGSPFCSFHADPNRAAFLGRLGGRKNRHYVETADRVPVPETAEDLKNLLAQAAADVLSGKLDPKKASALTSIASTLFKAMETTDLDERIAHLREELLAKSRNPDA